jgi:hypothetical protein
MLDYIKLADECELIAARIHPNYKKQKTMSRSLLRRCNDENSSWHDKCFDRRPIFFNKNQIAANSPPECWAETAVPPVKNKRRRKQGPIMYTKNLVEQGLGALNSDLTGDVSCHRPVCK